MTTLHTEGIRPWPARGLAVLSGLLSAAAFPSPGLWPLALVWAVPLFVAILLVPPGLTFARRVRRGKALGWLAGFTHFTATLWWIGHVSTPGMLALCAYLALYTMAGAGCAAALSRPGRPGGMAWVHGLLVAGVWTGLEWLRGCLLSGFPWNGPAVPLIELRSWSQAASITGLHGLALLPMLVSWTAALILTGTRALRISCAAGLGVLALVTGLTEWGLRTVREKADAAPDTRPLALLIQPGLTMAQKMFSPPEAQWSQHYPALTARADAAVAAHPDARLLVWPESAIPGLFHDPAHTAIFARFLTTPERTLITGADSQDWELHNSFTALRGNPDNYQVRPKIHLVPFGEFIPFREEIPLLEKMLGNLIPLDFSPGTSFEPVRLTASGPSLIPLVCFEDTIGQHARAFIRPEPQVLVNITNDNWFHESPATEMHFLNARWRTIELRRPLIRSANTGVTAVVETDGRVSARLPSFTPGTLAAHYTEKAATLTFYARHGDVFSQVVSALSLAGMIGISLHSARS